MSQRMLTFTLRCLERDGFIERTVYPTVPAQVDYRLTTIGASFTHMLASLATWSREHQAHITEAQAAYDAEHPGHDVR
ncbi:MAG: helix-turn-helix domain-containing protein [Corynebacterium sp.]|nr:helix-turn-helix domain-containing protein [Corynebacterium sp.]